ncbi:MAG TPA: hypothetical protein VN253_04125 [Kofleriaceae bacterium]|nr:hypothetical protein [Kofleriaceae bacterium]
MRGSRRVVFLLLLAGCGRPPSDAGRPVAFPTLEPDRPFDPRPIGLADLRSIAGAASIALEIGPGPVVATRGCDPTHAGGSDTLHGGLTCYRCTLAIIDQQPGAALHPLEVPLRTLADTLLQYPHSFLRVAQIEKIALCSQLAGDPPPADDQRVAGLAEAAAHRLMVSLDKSERARPDATLHHEIFHLFDYAAPRDGDHERDPAWERLNPRTFRYGPKPSSETEAGFINDYAKTALAEDKASVFEYLMSYPDELCARALDDPLLMGKARLLLERIEAAVPQNLGEFARRRAPCLARG